MILYGMASKGVFACGTGHTEQNWCRLTPSASQVEAVCSCYPRLTFLWSRIVYILHRIAKRHSMGLLPDTLNCGLRMCREYRERFPAIAG